MMPSNWAHLGGDDYLNLDTVSRVTFATLAPSMTPVATVTTTGADTLRFTGAPAEALKAALWRRTKGA